MALLGLPTTASAATFPADSDWEDVLQGGTAIGDVTGDGNNNGREIVGDSSAPAIQYYEDGTDFMVRMRLDVDPEQSTNNLRPYGWGLIIDTDGDYSAYEFALMVDGIREELVLGENSSQGTTGDPSDTAEDELYVESLSYGTNVQISAADSSINGDQDYWLDFAIPLTELVSAGLTSGTVGFVGGTSSSAQSLSLDIAGFDDDSGTATIADAISDDVTMGSSLSSSATCGDGTLDSGEECDDANTTNDDGCDAICAVEDGWECTQATFDLDFDEELDSDGSSPNWTLSSDGLTVTQSVNASPAVYMSTLPATGVSMTFELTVNTSSDDDFIGWVVGYEEGDNSNSSADWLLFD